MPTYIVLLRFTDQGMQRLEKTPAAFEMQKTMLAPASGVKLKNLYYVTGQYDAVAVVEAPDDITMARYALLTGSLGNVRTETLRAFTEEEVSKLVENLP
jgi:uncharacterized protein with GYD domain